jgi:hypothetical protein
MNHECYAEGLVKTTMKGSMLRIELMRLLDHFERAAGRCAPIYHQLLWTLAPMTVEAWSAFVSANEAAVGGRHEWDIFPDGQACGLLRGDGEGWEEFRRLAASGSLLLEAFKPEGESKVSAPGHHTWLSVVHDTAAAAATAILRLEYGLWGAAAETRPDELETLAKETTGGEVRFPKHPQVQTLHHDLFVSSAEAIRLWLDPDSAVTVGVPLCAWPVTIPVPECGSAPGIIKPVWLADRRELWVGESLIKRYKQLPGNQDLILSAFQELGWCDRIDDPLPGKPGVDSKARLRQTVEDLNKRHIAAGVLHFRGDGTGEGVIWDLMI